MFNPLSTLLIQDQDYLTQILSLISFGFFYTN